MNIDFFYNRIDEIFSDQKSRNVLKKQIDNYIELKELKISTNHKYKVGENVKLYKGMFMRGEGSLAELDDEKLKFISENGFISPDITLQYNKKQKTPLCIPVWNIQRSAYCPFSDVFRRPRS